MGELETVVDLILGLLGLPPLAKIKELSKKKSSRKVKVEIIHRGKKPENILKVLNELNDIVLVNELRKKIEGIRELYPATRVYGQYNGRVIIYGDMPGLLVYVFSEILALACGILDLETPTNIIEKLHEELSNNRQVNIQVFVVPGIPCVKACHMLSHMVLASPNIILEIVDIDTHSEYFEKYSDGALPLIVVNDRVRKTGSPKNYKELLELIKKSTTN